MSMVRGQNKNKAFQKRKMNPLVSVVDNEYDLEKNIKKINSYSRSRRSNKDKSHSHITDSGDNEDSNSRGNGFIEAPHASSAPLLTGDYAAWNTYTRLDDKITDFSDKNAQAHIDLRRELESKIKDANTTFSESIKDCNDAISKRLPIQWYIWTIIGLVTIVGIWYTLSYINVHPLPQKVEDIDKRLHSIEKKIDSSTKDTTLNFLGIKGKMK